MPLDRRSFLATVGTAILAGCSGLPRGSGDEPPATTTTTAGDATTATPSERVGETTAAETAEIPEPPEQPPRTDASLPLPAAGEALAGETLAPVGKDAIPSIDRPEFVGPEEVSRTLADGDVVFGLAYDGVARCDRRPSAPRPEYLSRCWPNGVQIRHMKPVSPVTVVLVLAVVVAGGAIAGGTTDTSGHAGALEFRETAEEAGFTYNATAPSGIVAGSGVYAADYDGDGWTDLLAVGGERPVLFENSGGRFAPSGELRGVEAPIRGALFLDYDADGDRDLVLLPAEGTPVVFATRGGSLERRPGVLDVHLERPVGATAGDYDRDGCPDLLVVQNGDWRDRRPESHDAPVHPDADNGNRNLLFAGTCGGFENATAAAGIRGRTWSLAASMVDLDGDGWPDVHVANDFNNDVVYWNDRDGTFTREVLPAETNRNAMASEVGEFSGDDRPDVFVTNIHLPPAIDGEAAFVAQGRADGNNLLVNEGDRRLSPSGERCGVREGGWGWAAVGADLDNDGDTDLYHTTLEFTGRLGTELLAARQRGPEYSYPVVFERRSGSTCGFVARNASTLGFEATNGHGTAGIDFDRDGDVDLAVATSPGAVGRTRYRLYENRATGNAIQVRVIGRPAAVDGARVVVDAGDTRTRVVHSRSDYFSQDERVVHVGLGNRSTAEVTVVRPDGTTQRSEDVEAGTRLVVSPGGIERTVSLDGSTSSPVAPGTAVGLLAAAVALGIAVVGYRRTRD